MKNYYMFFALVLSLSFITPVKAAPASSPLPADLLYFHAYLRYFAVSLQWGVTADPELMEFEVLRSPDDVNYTRIASVPAVHTNEPREKYWYTDREPLNGISYYRLKFIMSNGEEIIQDMFTRVNFFDLPPILTHPHPASQKMNISAQGATKILLTTLQGVTITEVPAEESSVDVSTLPAGMYLLKVQYGTEWRTKMITVK